jgi:chromosome partitioning protein
MKAFVNGFLQAHKNGLLRECTFPRYDNLGGKLRMLIGIVNSKGGVGKSTVAVHLAVWLQDLGRRVMLVDADVQSSSSGWLSEVAPEIPIARLQTADDILDQLPNLSASVDDVVIDGPGGLSEVSRSILFVVDYALLPCGPSVLDLRAASDAIRVLRQAQAIRKGPPEAIFVPNKLQVRHRLSREFLDTARTLEIRASSGLRLLKAYADAAGQGTVAWRMPREHEAGHEIKSLFTELFAHETTNHEPSVAKI